MQFLINALRTFLCIHDHRDIISEQARLFIPAGTIFGFIFYCVLHAGTFSNQTANEKVIFSRSIHSNADLITASSKIRLRILLVNNPFVPAACRKNYNNTTMLLHNTR